MSKRDPPSGKLLGSVLFERAIGACHDNDDIRHERSQAPHARRDRVAQTGAVGFADGAGFHVQVEAYGNHMPLNQLASISVPEARLLNVQVWDRSMVHAVEKAISAANLGLTPSTEGQVLRLRIPELNEERRREIVKLAHKYAEGARVAVRHVRRDGLDLLKKLEKDHKISEDEHNRQSAEVQKVTDSTIADVEKMLAGKEKEIMTV